MKRKEQIPAGAVSMGDLGDRLLRAIEVSRLLGIGQTSLWQGVKEGRFPAPIKLGVRTTRWRLSDIADLIEHGVMESSE